MVSLDLWAKGSVFMLYLQSKGPMYKLWSVLYRLPMGCLVCIPPKGSGWGNLDAICFETELSARTPHLKICVYRRPLLSHCVTLSMSQRSQCSLRCSVKWSDCGAVKTMLFEWSQKINNCTLI